MAIIPVDSCGELGLLQDIYSQELAPNAWSLAKNFRFREGHAEKMGGRLSVYGTPSITPHHLTNFLSVQGNQWVYAGLEKIYAVDSNYVHSNITRQNAGVDVNYTGTLDDKWNGGVLSGIVVLNNGVDDPQFWAGTGRAANLTNWPVDTKCKILRVYRNYLIAMNLTVGASQFPHLFRWSDVAAPGTLPASWDVNDPTNEAGAYDLADDQTELVDGLGLGEQFIAYKRSGYYAVQYIGAPFIFRFQKLDSLFGGALAANCVTEFPGGHFVLGPGDVYVHQAGPPSSVIDARNRKWLFKQLDGTSRERAFTVANPAANELLVCFPQTGDTYCTLALVWNWKYNTWGVTELPNILHACPGAVDFTAGALWSNVNGSWEESQLTWDQNLSLLAKTVTLFASPNDTRIYAEDVGTLFDTTAYESYVQRDNIRFDKPDSVKLLRQVRPLIEGPVGSGIEIYIASAYDQMASPQWFGPFPFIIGVDQKIDCHVIGRMLGVKFVSSGSFPWRLKRYDLDIQEIGMY